MNDNNSVRLDVNVYPTRKAMGEAAGKDIEDRIIQIHQQKETVRMIFAAAPSQNEALDYLSRSEKIEWNRIIAFHMDEYIGLPAGSPQLFSSYLKKRLFEKVPLKQINYIDTRHSIDDEVQRYAALINEQAIDIVCLGIGENGHIAFNDPPVADFEDPAIIKKVELDGHCRVQQVNDGCFPALSQVPETALTLTIPALLKADYLYCVVPGASKQQAVFNTLNSEISESCPATILQTHPHCKFYFDRDSYRLATS